MEEDHEPECNYREVCCLHSVCGQMSFKKLKESHILEHGVGSSQWSAYWELGLLLRRFIVGADTFYARAWFSADDRYIFTSVQGCVRPFWMKSVGKTLNMDGGFMCEN